MTPIGWTVETALSHIEALLVEMDRRYDERYRRQEAALEDAHNAAMAASNRQIAILAILAAIAGSIVYIWNPLHH